MNPEQAGEEGSTVLSSTTDGTRNIRGKKEPNPERAARNNGTSVRLWCIDAAPLIQDQRRRPQLTTALIYDL